MTHKKALTVHLRSTDRLCDEGCGSCTAGLQKNGAIGFNHCIMNPFRRFTARKKGKRRIETQRNNVKFEMKKTVKLEIFEFSRALHNCFPGWTGLYSSESSCLI